MSPFASVRVAIARLRACLDRDRLDRELAEELEFHVDRQAEEYVAGGMAPDAARRAARVRLGGVASIARQHRDARGLPRLVSLLEDAGFAWRALVRDRWFAATAVGALALGIGANATGFAVVNAAFVRPLPFPDADRLRMVWWERGPNRTAEASFADLQEWRAASSAFDLAAYRDTDVDVSDDRAVPEQVPAAFVTADLFDLLRQAPILGRGFAPGDDRPGAAPVVVLGHQLWTRRYGADGNVLGRTLRLDGRPATIVGVMPEGFAFPWRAALWAPFVPDPTAQAAQARVLSVVGRLRGRTSARQAQAGFDAIAARMKSADPDGTREFRGILIETLTQAFVGGMMPTMIATIMAGVGFVLLIACANVAHLLLSRADVRARDIALRLTLGAPRWRVLRQLLVESLLLASAGGAIGLVLARVGSAWFERAMQVSGKPYWMVFSIDGSVVAYVAAVCVGTAVLFGIAPALHLWRTDTGEVLKEGGRGSVGGARVRGFGRAMVGVQIALTMVLLGGGASIVRSVLELSTLDVGIDASRLVALQLELPETTYASREARLAFVDRLDARLADVPAIERVAWTTGVPPLDGGERLVEVERSGEPGAVAPRFTSVAAVSPTFFDAVGRPLVAGRPFASSDGSPGAEAAIVNQRFADRFFPGGSPIGGRFRFTVRDPAPGQPPEPWRTIVGISAPIRQGSPQDAYLGPVAYVPYREDAARTVALLVKSADPPAVVREAVAREVQGIDADLPVVSGRTIEEVAAADRWPFAVFGGLFAALAVMALMLSSVGLYAVTARSVVRRTQEFGVRLAIGATRGQVCRLVLRQALGQFAMAVPIGLAGAVALGVVLQGLLVDMGPADPVTLVTITGLLLTIAIAACLVPAWRATRVDPASVLRTD